MKKLKKALRGYSPAAVRQMINDLQENHRIRMEELREQFMLLADEQQRLAAEMESVNEAEKRQPAVLSDQTAAKRLLEAHLTQTEAVWKILHELKDQEEKLQAEDQVKQSERDRMLEHVERRLKDTLSDIAEGRGIT